MELNVSVAMAKLLLDTEYHIYVHPSGVKQIGTPRPRCNGHYNRTPDLGKCGMW